MIYRDPLDSVRDWLGALIAVLCEKGILTTEELKNAKERMNDPDVAERPDCESGEAFPSESAGHE